MISEEKYECRKKEEGEDERRKRSESKKRDGERGRERVEDDYGGEEDEDEEELRGYTRTQGRGGRHERRGFLKSSASAAERTPNRLLEVT